MGEVKLLDCTLRDGGYINDWNFGHNNLVSVFERLVDAGVDFVEVGFLDDRRPYDYNRSIMPDTASVDRIFAGLDKKDATVVGMIDYGTCKLENIGPCTEDGFLDGIRVIFKKHLRKEALDYCAKLKEKGYKVFAQLVSVTAYEDDEMMDLIRLANEVKPFAVSMVDTYGLMHQDNLMHYFDLLNDHLLPEIGIGYHGHNNFQMGYANCIQMLSRAEGIERMMLVDGTIYGMGKSAGNAPIELVAMHMNDNYGKDYHISQMLEAIDANIMDFYQNPTWGYNAFFFIAALNNVHPSYVSDLMNKRTLSVKAINQILGKLEGEKKLLYDKNYLEELYLDYQNVDVDDTKDREELKKIFADRKVLLLGPGANVDEQKERIEKYVIDNKPLIVSINFVSDEFRPDYIFLSNAKRYVQLATELAQKQNEFKVIATSNVTKTSGNFDYTLKYADLLDYDAEIIDNSFIMLLKVMIGLGVKHVALGGFDGYVGDRHKNYVDQNMEYKFDKKQAENLNEYVCGVLDVLSKDIEMEFITDSLYAQK